MQEDASGDSTEDAAAVIAALSALHGGSSSDAPVAAAAAAAAPAASARPRSCRMEKVDTGAVEDLADPAAWCALFEAGVGAHPFPSGPVLASAPAHAAPPAHSS